MPNPPLDEAKLQQALDALAQYGTVKEAAEALGVARTTLSHRVNRARGAVTREPVEFPVIPSETLSPLRLVEACSERFEQLQRHESAKVWANYKLNVDGPFAICWFGDPHVDDNGCNWPLLRQHLRICRETPGMFAANIGDTLNNWSGRLEKLWAEQDTSHATAAVLARYLIEGDAEEGRSWWGGTGPKWLVWLLGNHDLWGQLAAWMRASGAHVVPMYDWQARFVLQCPNGREVRIWAAHDFGKFSSQWNDLHSLEKAAKMKDSAHLYVGGHTHNWGVKKTESASRGTTYTLARCRGYKYIDAFGEQLGHNPQQYGASVVSVIDPDADDDSLVECFVNVERAASYLTWLRSRRGA